MQDTDFSADFGGLRHRTTTIKDDLRAARLIPIVKSIEESWLSPEFNTFLESFQGFCELVAVDKAQLYFFSRQANQIKDWSSWTLDDEGKSIQAQLNERTEVGLGDHGAFPYKAEYRTASSNSNDKVFSHRFY